MSMKPGRSVAIEARELLNLKGLDKVDFQRAKLI